MTKMRPRCTPSRWRPRVFGGVAAVIASGSVLAADASLSTRNQSTLARGFALPPLGQTAPETSGTWRVSVDLTSEYVLKEEGAEALLLDGETQRYGLRYVGGWGEGDRGDWSIELPLLHGGGGFMDGIIEDWHDVFALPDGGRDDAPRDRYHYRYVRDGVVVLDAESGGTNLGDIELGAGWQLVRGLMLRGIVKLPTGDEDELAGGNLGGATWLDWAWPMPEGGRVSGFVSGGVSVNEEAGALEDLQETLIPFGGIGVGVRVLPSLQAITQLYAHAPLYDDTEITALERAGLQFTLGGRWCPGSGSTCMELSFQEDFIVASSPDFSLRLALALR
ncbi:MAG: hypothetical protein K0Q76_4054 [Panacagrimonas sp.]|nr:DUF3187 family protein [Panacagrimonas sp.]MCC2658946.1 hypothetical protein [Panacagrimonas sp.]